MESFDIAALQLANIDRLESYWKICSEQGARLLLLGEYVVEPFLHDWQKNIEENLARTQELLAHFVDLSKTHKTILATPILHRKDKKIYKSFALIKNGKVRYANAQRLLGFEHWNEKELFANTTPKNPRSLPTLEICGLKVAFLFGFETYFDAIWIKLRAQNVDVVCVATAATFGSQERWRAILQSRAFLNSCYVLRANRIGAYCGETTWEFYGDSLFVAPSGAVESFLGKDEELLIAKILPEHINEYKTYWKFR